MRQGRCGRHKNDNLSIRHYLEHAAARVVFLLESLFPCENVDKIIMTGGAAAIRFLPVLVATLSQKTVEVVKFPELTALGAGMYAAAAMGLPNLSERAKEMFLTETYEPEISNEYADWYATSQRPVFAEQLNSPAKFLGQK